MTAAVAAVVTGPYISAATAVVVLVASVACARWAHRYDAAEAARKDER